MIQHKINNQPIGVFGSSFDPLHLGHIRLMVEAQKCFLLDRIKVIPTYHSPLKFHPPTVSASNRLALLKKALKSYSFLEVDDQEIKRKTLSYMIDTLQSIRLKFSNIFLIIGKDQLLNFNQWRDFETIITISNVIVGSRNGLEWTPHLFPKLLQKKIKQFHSSKVLLTTGRSIYALTIKDLDISSSQIRKKISCNQSVKHLVPHVVNQWIAQYGW